MRDLSFGLKCGACLVAASCNSAPAGSPNKPPAGALTNDPQKIVSDPGSIRTLHGEFEIRDAKPNEAYMAPASIGGACLVAQIPVEGKSCTTQSECEITPPGQPKWTGYCLGPNHLPATNGGTCWVKLSDDKNCLKLVGKGKHSTPSMDVSAAYSYVAQQSPNWRRPIDWALLGCLNGVPPGGCGGGAGPHVYSSSPVRPVP